MNRSCFRLSKAAALMIWIIMGVALPPAAVAHQDGDFRFNRISIDDGLISSSIYSIARSDDGRLFLGSSEGIAIWNGDEVVVEPSIDVMVSRMRDRWVTALEFDSRGRLWIGGNGGDIFVADISTVQSSIRTFSLSPGCPNVELPSKTISDILEISPNLFLVAVVNEGVWTVDLTDGTMCPTLLSAPAPEHRALRNAYKLLRDTKNRIWVGTWALGLFPMQFDESERRLELLPDLKPPFPATRIRDLVSDPNGSIWIGTSGAGVLNYEPEEKLLRELQSLTATENDLAEKKGWSLALDATGQLWIATYDKGGAVFDTRSRVLSTFQWDPDNEWSLSTDRINTMYLDSSGMAWFGTDKGVNFLPVVQHRIQNPKLYPGVENGAVRSISTLGDSVMAIGRDNSFQVLSFSNLEAGPRTTFQVPDVRLPGRDVRSVVRQKDGTIWAGTGGAGLFRFDPATHKATHVRLSAERNSIAEAIRGLVLDDQHRIWVGTGGYGLVQIDTRTSKVTERIVQNGQDDQSISSNKITHLWKDEVGNLVLGSYEPVIDIWSPGRTGIQHFNLESGTDVNRLFAPLQGILKDSSSGAYWAATGGGLVRFDPESDSVFVVGMENGLLSNSVTGVGQTSDGAIWAMTERALSEFNPETGRVINYPISIGFPMNEFEPGTFNVLPEDRLVVGGDGRVAVVDAVELRRSASYEPPFHVRLNSKVKSGSLEEGVTLNYASNNIDIEVSLADFQDPASIVHEYQLEGLESRVQTASGTVIRIEYADLPARSTPYVLKLVSTSPHGNRYEREITFFVPPPLWERVWFIVSMFALAIGMLAGRTTISIRRKKREAAEMQRLLAEGREEERIRLSRTLHDDPLQHLYSLKHHLEILESAMDPSFKDDENLEMAQDIATQTMLDLRRICGELRPTTLAPFGLEKTIRAQVREFLRSHPDVTIELELAKDEQRYPEDIRIILFRVYQGAMTNIARHAEATRISIELTEAAGRVTLSIQDDGVGFDVPTSKLYFPRKGHYGLLGMREWAAAVGGRLHVDSEMGSGTRISITLPLNGGNQKRASFLSVLDRFWKMDSLPERGD